MRHLEAIIERNCTSPSKRYTRKKANHLSPQSAKLLDYLSEEGREITQMVAISILGIGSLTARISDLKRAGYEIQATRKHEIRGGTYTSYKLIATPHEKKRERGS